MKLAQKAVRMALEGNVTMMIFCLKNINQWSDRTVLTTNTSTEGAKLVIDFGEAKSE
jgi:hypothetical protein